MKESQKTILVQLTMCLCMHVYLFSLVWLFVTPWTVAHHSPLVHMISQARTLEWVANSFSRGSSLPRD